MLSVRPKVAELVAQLYGRVLHPELFEVYSEKRIQRGRVAPPASTVEPQPLDKTPVASGEAEGYEAQLQITSAGHVVTWRRGELTLTEVFASSHQPLPDKRRLMSRRVEGEQTERVECRGGVVYEATFALEAVSPEKFQAYQQEFDLLSLQQATPGVQEIDETTGSSLLHRFDASGRAVIKLGAVSYLDVQARDRSLRVRALHTFPDDCAIVRSESVFRLPG